MRRNDRARPDNGSAARATEAQPPGTPSNARWLAPILIAGALVAAVVLGLFVLGPKPTAGAGSSSGIAEIGGPFQLVDQDGRPVDQSVLNGRWSAVFFGYTFCPDICPATLTALNGAKQRMGDRARDLQVVFVSIDPERDTPDAGEGLSVEPRLPTAVDRADRLARPDRGDG